MPPIFILIYIYFIYIYPIWFNLIYIYIPSHSSSTYLLKSTKKMCSSTSYGGKQLHLFLCKSRRTRVRVLLRPSRYGVYVCIYITMKTKYLIYGCIFIYVYVMQYKERKDRERHGAEEFEVVHGEYQHI